MNNEDIICDKYKNTNISISKIASEYNLYYHQIYKILKKYNIPFRGAKKLDEEIVKNIKTEYLNGLTMREISSKLKIDVSTIGKYLKKQKVKTRYELGIFKRKYNLDESVMENIDTHEKAQFLGLIYSDGSLSKYNNNISIRLNEADKDYLDDWNTKLLKTDRPLHSYKKRKFMISPINGKKYKIKHNTYILDISSHIIYKHLLKIGLLPNKSKANLKIPKIDKKYMFSFILGLFVGDGCVSYCDKSRNFTIACQENMAKDLNDFFKDNEIVSHIYNRKFIWILQISRKQDLLKLYNYLYENSKIFMRRKKEKFEELLKNCNMLL